MLFIVIVKINAIFEGTLTFHYSIANPYLKLHFPNIIVDNQTTPFVILFNLSKLTVTLSKLVKAPFWGLLGPIPRNLIF